MYQTKLKAIITEKESKKSSVFEIMNMRYSVTDNTLWIIDHRGHLIDFDLNQNEVEIVHADKKCLHKKSKSNDSTVEYHEQYYNDLIEKKVLVHGKYNEKIICIVVGIEKDILCLKDEFGNKCEFSINEIIGVLSEEENNFN